jgi:hypothetical protein
MATTITGILVLGNLSSIAIKSARVANAEWRIILTMSQYYRIYAQLSSVTCWDAALTYDSVAMSQDSR